MFNIFIINWNILCLIHYRTIIMKGKCLKNSIKNMIFIFILIFLSACGDESNYDNTPLSENNSNQSKSIKLGGTLVDGYIKGATVCIDLDHNNICDISEPNVLTDDNGTFGFQSRLFSEDSLINILASGGVDTSTQKNFNEQLQTVLSAHALEQNASVIISPITDLVSLSFLNNNGEDALDLSDAKTSVSDMFDITISQVDEDPMKDINIFTISQEIQHTKLLIKTLCEKNLGSISASQEIELLDDIKKEILEQNLNAERIMISLEVKLSLDFEENEKTFVKEQAEELKNTLNALSKDTSLSIDNLNRLQKSLDIKQQEAYDMLLAADANTTLEVLDLNITSESITQTPFNTTNAIHDPQACMETNGYMKLSNSSISESLSEDADNQISVKSNYPSTDSLDMSEVIIFYPPLENEKTGSVALLFGDAHYFVYDEAWTQNSNRTVYIQTPKDDGGLHACFRYELDTILTSDVQVTKVFSYLEL